VAVLMLTHVNYRTGAMHDMAVLTALAHRTGALAVWDLAHSAGAVPVDLHATDADFAVGCGYKYLNGGAPAFVGFIRGTRILREPCRMVGLPCRLVGGYCPRRNRTLAGQPILSMAAPSVGSTPCWRLSRWAAWRRYAATLALTDLFIRLVEERCAGHGLGLATPRQHDRRGSQVCLTRPAAKESPGGSGAYAIVQALIARGVIGDYRAGDGASHDDILRFGFPPLYIGFEDVWQAVEHLHQVLDTGEWRRPEFNQKHAVT
jgi:kynureninase